MIAGFAPGTVTQGGQLYDMNLEDNTVIPIFEDLTVNEEIMSIKPMMTVHSRMKTCIC
ncbi:hypothetical protein AB1K89_06935 [Sporosarcina sp. 179-K 8C2 HS]|uniref:DUF4652 domain-containing protein n=1 Tax=Sporosarcina sp. 179-K 8C2 HS TaxID=3142387 RepID=UPI00399FA360